MNRITLIITVLFCCVHLSSGQNTAIRKSKIYESWILFNNQSSQFRGVLYEIKDSAILVKELSFISDSAKKDYNISELKYDNLKLIYTRRVNSIKRGAWIGAISGLCTGLVITAVAGGMSDGGFDSWGPIIYSYAGISGAAAGAIIGALTGSVRNRIEIYGNVEHFELNRGKLQDYSYVHEYPGGSKLIKQTIHHRSYIGIVLGPSFPLGAFTSYSDNENTGEIKTGYFDNIINLGFRITQRYGVSMIAFGSQYEVSNDQAEIWYGLNGIMAGPLVSIPFKEKIYFDLKPRIGYTDTQLTVDEINTKNGISFGMNLNLSVQYNFSRRWCLLAETGYFNTRTKLNGNSKLNVQVYNLDLGIAYRFR